MDRAAVPHTSIRTKTSAFTAFETLAAQSPRPNPLTSDHTCSFSSPPKRKVFLPREVSEGAGRQRSCTSELPTRIFPVVGHVQRNEAMQGTDDMISFTFRPITMGFDAEDSELADLNLLSEDGTTHQPTEEPQVRLQERAEGAIPPPHHQTLTDVAVNMKILNQTEHPESWSTPCITTLCGFTLNEGFCGTSAMADSSKLPLSPVIGVSLLNPKKRLAEFSDIVQEERTGDWGENDDIQYKLIPFSTTSVHDLLTY